MKTNSNWLRKFIRKHLKEHIEYYEQKKFDLLLQFSVLAEPRRQGIAKRVLRIDMHLDKMRKLLRRI